MNNIEEFISKDNLLNEYGMVYSKKELLATKVISINNLKKIGGYRMMLNHFGLTPTPRYNSVYIDNIKKLKEYIDSYMMLNKGEIPTCEKVRAEKIVTDRFILHIGGYINFLKDNGYDVEKRVPKRSRIEKYTDDELISIFKSIYTELEPSISKLDSDYKDGKIEFGYEILKLRYGQYSNFIQLCKYNSEDKKYNENILKIKSFILSFGKTPTKNELIKNRIVSHRFIAKYGGYSTIIKSIGQVPRCVFCTDITKEELSDIILSVYKNIPPTMSKISYDYRVGNIPFGIGIIKYHFVTFTNMLLELNYPLNENNGIYSNKKNISVDGNICDSYDEYSVDLFLHENNIKHSHQDYYKSILKTNKRYRMDFLLYDGTVVEYFGLSGREEYDNKTSIKLSLLDISNISYIAIYPKDLNNLKEIFKDYMKEGEKYE